MATRGAAESGGEFAALRAGDRGRRRRGRAQAGARAEGGSVAAVVMEIEVGDAHVWIWRDADIGMATAILRALQTASRAK